VGWLVPLVVLVILYLLGVPLIWILIGILLVLAFGGYSRMH
jgi:hypothetical protein